MTSINNQPAAPKLSQQEEFIGYIEDLFIQGDTLMFKIKDFTKAEAIYRKIIDLDPTSIDALNSLANCIKFKKSATFQNQIPDQNQQNEIFDAVYPIYLEALKLDRDDVEANFNMGLLFLQLKQDLNKALVFFQNSLNKDKASEIKIRGSSQLSNQNAQIDQQIQDLYRAQFSKAYYNIGMINDRLGEIQKASTYYKRAIDKCEEDATKLSLKSSHYMRAVTNYAVTLEKIGKRDDSIQLLSSLKKNFTQEVRIHNNLGIIQKRNGQMAEAEKSFQEALNIDKNSFFPNYNLGVLKAQSMKEPNKIVQTNNISKESILYFEQALVLASINKEDIYEINTLVNMSIVYEKSDNIPMAIQSLEKALALDQSNQKLKQKLMQLKGLEQRMKQLQPVKDIYGQQKQENTLIDQNLNNSIEKLPYKVKNNEQEIKITDQKQGIDKGQYQMSKEIETQLIKIKQEQDKKIELFKMQQKEEYLQAMKQIQDMTQQDLQQMKNQLEQQKYIKESITDFKQQQEQQFTELIRQHQEEKERLINDFKKKRDQTFLQEQERRLRAEEVQNKGLVSPPPTDQPKVVNQKQRSISPSKKDQSSSSNLRNQPSMQKNTSSSLAVKSNLTLSKQKSIDIQGLQKSLKSEELPELQQKEIARKMELSQQMENSRGGIIDEYGDVKDEKIQKQLDQVLNAKVEMSMQIEAQSKQNSAMKNQEEKKEHIDHHHHHQHLEPVIEGMQFLRWTKSECDKILASQPQHVKALFRRGVIDMEEQQFGLAMQYFQKAQQVDMTFMPVHLLMKMGECLYKTDNCQAAIDYFQQAADHLKPKSDYLVELFIGKCYDKMMKFPKAIESYQRTLVLYVDEKDPDTILIGNVQFRLGWTYVRSRQNFDKGIEHLKIAQKCLPKNADILVKLANVLFKEKGQADEAMYYIDQCQMVAPLDPESYMLQGKIYMKKEQNELALQSFEKAIKLYADQKSDAPPKAVAFFYLGNCLENIKDFKKAILNYKKCLTLDNKHFGACIHLANLLANIGEGQRAAKYFKHGIKIDETSINARFGLGKALQQFSENKEAPIEHFQKVIDKDPNHFKAYTQLGILYLDKEDYQKSADCLKKALSINRSFPLALVSMGNLLFETGHADEAIKYHKQALQINDQELQALIGLGNAYYDSNHPKESIQYYKKALKIDDQLSDVHYNLGNALYLVEKIDDAIVHYKSAIALNPKKSESYYNLGNALCVKNEYANAIQSYLQALEIDPKNAPALYNLGNAYYMTNRFEDAIKVYIKALDLNEGSAECHFNLASAYNDIGNFQKALIHYQRAIELDHNNVDAYLCMGGVLETLKQLPLAEKQYRIALEKDPDNQRAKESIVKIQKLKK